MVSCDMRTRNKTLNHPLEGFLKPLLIPHCPWSHNALNFVTGLSPLNNNTCVLTFVDRFSKSAHFILLPKLPSTKETAKDVFWLYGLPVNIVSDRGPKFSAQSWKAFCSLFGTTPSLSSGFHPQGNGQTERINRELERLRTSSTGMSPFQCCLGY